MMTFEREAASLRPLFLYIGRNRRAEPLGILPTRCADSWEYGASIRWHLFMQPWQLEALPRQRLSLRPTCSGHSCPRYPKQMSTIMINALFLVEGSLTCFALGVFHTQGRRWVE